MLMRRHYEPPADTPDPADTETEAQESEPPADTPAPAKPSTKTAKA